MALDPDVLAAELPGLMRYAMYLTRNRTDADDLVQDTLERAVTRGDTFRGDSSPTTWLHRVMHRRFLDTRRRRAPEPTPDDLLIARVEAAWRDDAYTVDPEVVLGRAEVQAELRDALVHLPVILRSAVVLHDMQGLTSVEVATVQGIGLPAAKQRLRRGRALLVSLLADDDDRRLAMKGVPDALLAGPFTRRRLPRRRARSPRERPARGTPRGVPDLPGSLHEHRRGVSRSRAAARP